MRPSSSTGITHESNYIAFFYNTFFFDKAEDIDFLNQMNLRANDNGIKNLLIMCDAEGDLGDPDKVKRKKSVENHHKWVNAAKYLGCHSIRVNARSSGEKQISYEDQQKYALDGLQELAEYAKEAEINIIVENHGGLSSNGKWLSEIMNMAKDPSIGTLPDFGNFKINENDWYDRYQGVDELMPYAKAVSAKVNSFDENGEDLDIDYTKMLKVVKDSNYSGYISVEQQASYEDNIDPIEAINLTKELLLKSWNKLS